MTTNAGKIWYNLGNSLEEKPEFAIRAYERAVAFYQNEAEKIANDGMNEKDLENAIAEIKDIEKKIDILKSKQEN